MKTRRELFEEQLRDLQKDISSLSNKLAAPGSSGITNNSNAANGSICIVPTIHLL